MCASRSLVALNAAAACFSGVLGLQHLVYPNPPSALQLTYLFIFIATTGMQ
jgi:hypothetical protein